MNSSIAKRLALSWLALGCLAEAGCTPPEPPPPRPAPPKVSEGGEVDDPQAKAAARTDGLTGGKLVFSDNFDRTELGADWTVKHEGEWLLQDGQLKPVRLANEDERNQGLWLNQPLPPKVRVTFESKSLTKIGDTKCEIFGTEPKHESGYSVIFGGWNNTINAITRKGEHEPRRVTQSEFVRVEQGRTYTWTIVRTDGVLRWYVDGKFMIAYDDADPVRGSAFGFNNWANDVRIDNLKIFAL